MVSQRKLVLYIAASLDGYIATSDHSLDWLFAVEGEGDNGYAKFYDTVDTVLMGRITYDWIIGHPDGAFPYKGKECYVFSRTPKPVNENAVFVSEDAATFAENLKNKSGKNIWVVGGGELIHTYIKNRLVDEITVTIAPVILGGGIPLFKDNEFQTSLELQNITRYNQFVELHYEVKGHAGSSKDGVFIE